MAPQSVKWLAIDAASKSLSADEAAGNVLRKLGKAKNVNIISIFGAARQGKSFLMNLLAGEESLFQISNSRTACTQGADLSNVFKPVSDFANIRPAATEPGRSKAKNVHDTLVGFADLEGQGDQDVTYDAKLMTPVLLSSSAVIFNWKGGMLKDQILDILAIAAKAAQCVDVSSGEDDEVAIFGHLHIVFRDWNFARETNDQDRVFHDLFDAEKGYSDTVQKQNSARNVVKAAFKSIKIWLLPPPVEKTDDLSKELSFGLLQDSFVQEVASLRGSLCEQVCVETRFAGQRLNGPRIASLVPQLVDIVNSEETILPQSVFTSMMVADADSLVKELLKSLERDLESMNTGEDGQLVPPNRFEVSARARELQLVEDFSEAFGDVSMGKIRSKMEEMCSDSNTIVVRAIEKNVSANDTFAMQAGEEVLNELEGKLEVLIRPKLPLPETELQTLYQEFVSEHLQKLQSVVGVDRTKHFETLRGKLEKSCDRELQSLIRESKLKEKTMEAVIGNETISAADELRTKLTTLSDDLSTFRSADEIVLKVNTLKEQAIAQAVKSIQKELDSEVKLNVTQMDKISAIIDRVSKSFESSLGVAFVAYQKSIELEEKTAALEAQLKLAAKEKEDALQIAEQNEKLAQLERAQRAKEELDRVRALEESKAVKERIEAMEKANIEAREFAKSLARKEAESAEATQQKFAELESKLKEEQRRAQEEAQLRKQAEAGLAKATKERDVELKERATAEAKRIEAEERAREIAQQERAKRLAAEEKAKQLELIKEMEIAKLNKRKRDMDDAEDSSIAKTKRRKSTRGEGKENNTLPLVQHEDMEVDEESVVKASKSRGGKSKAAKTPKKTPKQTGTATSKLEEVRRKMKEEQEKRLQDRLQKLQTERK